MLCPAGALIGGVVLVGELGVVTFEVGTAGFSEGQLAILDLIESGELDSLGAQAYLEGMAAQWELGIDAAAIVILDHFHISENSHTAYHYGRHGAYMGGAVPGPGGLAEPPGFPGFPGSGIPHMPPGLPPGAGWVCYIDEGGLEWCHLEI